MSHNERTQACEECLELFHRLGNEAYYVTILNNLGYLELEAGQITTARERLAEAVRIAGAIGDQRGLSLYSCNLGFASYLAQADTDAEAMFDKSERIARRNGDLMMIAYAHLGRALIASRAGHPRTAAALHGAADSIHQQLGTSVEGLESRLREADITRLREEIGDTEFELAYATEHTPQRSSTTPPIPDTHAPPTSG